MIYLDTSALLKLVVEEAESEALVAWLSQRRDLPRVASALVSTELLRAVGRTAPEADPQARALLRQLELIPVSAQVLLDAGAVQPWALRSLDAIHLVSAGLLADVLTAVVSYDRRLLDAAEHAGLPVAAPGGPGCAPVTRRGIAPYPGGRPRRLP